MSSRLRRAAAPFVLAVWLAGLVLPVFGAGHTLGFDDAACERPLWSNGHPVTALEKDAKAQGNGHCGICHLQRAVCGALHSVVRTVQYDPVITARTFVCQSDLRTRQHQVSSSRAPPSLLVSQVS
jgi:hypothetical protein